MKKFLMLLCAVVLVFGMVGSASAATYQFEDMIDDWEIDGTIYGSVYIDQQYSILPNYVGSSFSYTHDINDEVNFAAGDLVTEANLELDFVNMEGVTGLEGDSYGSTYFFGWHYYDSREYVQYTYDSGISSWVEIDTDNDIQTALLTIDWLNSDGLLDVTINLWNTAGTADIGLDHSKLYGTAETAPVPEPATILLMGIGLLGMVGIGRKRFNKKG